MRLSYSKEHKSINQEFDPIDLPDFTVLTGLNGSGKTHLLEAVKGWQIRISAADHYNIIYFNSKNFNLDEAMDGGGEPSESELNDNFRKAQRFHQMSKELLYDDVQIKKYSSLKKKCNNEIPIWEIENSDLLRSYRSIVNEIYNYAEQEEKERDRLHEIVSIAKKIPYFLHELTFEDFKKYYKPYDLKGSLLPKYLNQIISIYSRKLLANRYNKFSNSEFKTNLEVLSDEDFISRHGLKPWDRLNEILKDCGLPYHVPSPEKIGFMQNYEFNLVHNDADKQNIKINFSDLSSGEKILMALVASSYKEFEDKHFPGVILLDEIDASLHPSMITAMLNVIETVFLGNGVKVILATHSLSTVALAGERFPESIHVMHRDGKKRIEKVDTEKALDILTEGITPLQKALKLFDLVANSELTIVSEGKNINFIKQIIDINGLTDRVDVFEGGDNRSGKDQLKALYEFFIKVPHKNKVLFVWDCDVTQKNIVSLQPENKTYPYIFEKNEDNKVAPKGIENMFPEELFENFKGAGLDNVERLFRSYGYGSS
jgi:predicted ATPase